MNMRTKIAILVCLVAILALALEPVRAAEEWKAPPEAAQVKNPVAKDKESLARGKRLYMRYCMNCHGISGKGDGPEAAGLDPKPGNFSDAAKMNAQTDGELFWKLTNGKGKMKPYAEVSPTHTDQEKWDLVNYIRTFAPEGKKAGDDQGGKSAKDDPPAPSKEHDAFIADYLSALAGLNRGKLAAVRENAVAMSALASRNIFGQMAAISRAETEDIAKDLLQSADQLKKAKDVAAARQAFSALSKRLNDWLTSSQFQYKTSLTVYRCPPSPSGEPAIWIQKTGAILNPYQVKDPSQCDILKKIGGRNLTHRNP
jgi:mono/diheme cytochrome c family protein